MKSKVNIILIILGIILLLPIACIITLTFPNNINPLYGSDFDLASKNGIIGNVNGVVVSIIFLFASIFCFIMAFIKTDIK